MSTETLIVETETVIATPEPPIIELKDVEVTFNSRTGSLFKPNKVYAVRGQCHVRPPNANEGPSVLQRRGSHQARCGCA